MKTPHCLPGPVGPRGPQGVRGRDGRDGRDGHTGFNGFDGAGEQINMAEEGRPNIRLIDSLLPALVFHFVRYEYDVYATSITMMKELESCRARFLASRSRNAPQYLTPTRTKPEKSTFYGPDSDRPDFILPDPDRTEAFYHQPGIIRFRTTTNL